MNINHDPTEFTKVSDLKIPDIFYNRIKTGLVEIDEIFGQGILPGSSTTITSRWGLGKTTFLLQILEALTNNGYNCAYASGEENIFQLAYNCERLGVRNIKVANQTNIDSIVEHIKVYDVLVIDSFQALTATDELNSKELERYAINTLVKAAKDHECALFFILHLTKAGTLKGGSLIPHSVDVNMQILSDEGNSDGRIIEVSKNRFGACGDFSSVMTEKGFIFTGKKEEAKSENKSSRRTKLMEQILAMETITKGSVMAEFSLTSSQAYLVLREMCELGTLAKYGRGDDAIFGPPGLNISV